MQFCILFQVVIDRDPCPGVPVKNSLLTGTLSNVRRCWLAMPLGAKKLAKNRTNLVVQLAPLILALISWISQSGYLVWIFKCFHCLQCASFEYIKTIFYDKKYIGPPPRKQIFIWKAIKERKRLSAGVFLEKT